MTDGPADNQGATQVAADWTDEELRAAVRGYLEMLELQEQSTPFKKSEHNKQLREGTLAGRTKASVEYRMQNISAVLQGQGLPWLAGYVPAKNVGPNVRAKIAGLLREARQPSSRRRREHLLDDIKLPHILEGIKLFNEGHPHSFGDSTKFDLLYEDRPYPPKAIIGLAGVPLYGEALNPGDFSGGANSKCFRLLSQNGFQIVPKLSEFGPTAEEKLLEARTREAMAAPNLPKPSGQHSPKQVEKMALVFERDPLVRAFVLKRAAGKCECCLNKAPFLDRHDEPFLEVHHIQPLAEAGEDVADNAVAICPNCHRECHYGRDADELRHRLVRLSQESR